MARLHKTYRIWHFTALPFPNQAEVDARGVPGRNALEALEAFAEAWELTGYRPIGRKRIWKLGAPTYTAELERS